MESLALSECVEVCVWESVACNDTVIYKLYPQIVESLFLLFMTYGHCWLKRVYSTFAVYSSCIWRESDVFSSLVKTYPRAHSKITGIHENLHYNNMRKTLLWSSIRSLYLLRLWSHDIKFIGAFSFRSIQQCDNASYSINHCDNFHVCVSVSMIM